MSPANEQNHDQSPDATIASITSAKLKAEDRTHLLAIENAIERMKHYTPTDPYVLTIPQDVEPRYHHYSSGQARQWLHNTPFDPREHEATQYQTFVYHEPGKDMYQLHVSRAPAEEDEGRGSVRGRGAGGGTTGANTPAQGEKKKISLGDYKRKVVGGTPDPTAAKDRDTEMAAKKAPPVKGPIERIKADQEVLAAVEDAEDVVKQALREEGEKKELKRKRGDSLALVKEQPKDKEAAEKVVDGDEHAPAKKARRTSPPVRTPKRKNSDKDTVKRPTESSQQAQPKADTPNPPEIGTLPPKLSPPPPASKTKESTENPTSISLLPGRLSPTIPSNITSTLAARAHYRSTSRSSELSASGHRSASKDPASRHFTPPPKSVPRNGFRANSNSPAVRSDVEDRGRAVKPALSRPKTPEIDGDDEVLDEIAVSKKKGVPQERDASKEEDAPRRLLVRFKFKKSQREAVRRILRMRPNPIKVLPSERPSAEGDEGIAGRRTSRSSVAGRRDTNAKGVAQKVGPANGTTKDRRNTADSNSPPALDRKRPRSESDDSDTLAPAKRRKGAPDNIEVKNYKEPSTPAPSDLLSPSSAQKPASQQLTPNTMRKDVLSAAMKREHSTDSRLNTPPAMSQNSPTVNGTSQSQTAMANGGAGRTDKDRQPSNKTPKQQAWEREQKRLETLGRELKHAASDHFKSLSLTHSDASAPSKEQKLAAITALESLLAYMLAFTCADEAALAADPKLQPSTKTWKSLHGFFGFVKRHCDAFPELVGLVCWLGVIFNSRILELTTAASAQDNLLETTAMMQRAAIEADTKLDVDLLQSNFPKTWEGRFQGSLAPASEMLEVGKGFKGLYKLPLGLQSSPLRAARAGYAMLEEWVGREAKEGGYEFKLVF